MLFRSWERPSLFRWLQRQGGVPEADLWNTFNLGVGFCLVLPADQAKAAMAICQTCGHKAWELGRVRAQTGPDGLAGLPYESPANDPIL